MSKKKVLFLYFLFFIILVIALFFIINYFTGVFDPFLGKVFKKYSELIPQTEAFLFKQAFAGISMGLLILTIVLLIYPLFFPHVDVKNYYRDFIFGILTAVVFYITEQFKTILSKFKAVDFLFVILGMILFTYLLIEAIASIFKNKQKGIEFKSQTIANILSGIVFSMILTVIKTIFKQN
ncbi:MAG: hypothetical protein GX435_04975 [Exilispira sp.]|nr:hypothetical protein [Exilispira sp.]